PHRRTSSCTPNNNAAPPNPSPASPANKCAFDPTLPMAMLWAASHHGAKTMQYRQLGHAGVRVSAIGLGSYLTIGMSIDDTAARDTFHAALDNGINFIDTADAYNKGEAEKALAALL